MTSIARIISAAAVLIVAAPLAGQQPATPTTTDPFPTPITASEGVIAVNFRDFASLPDIGGQAARPMLMVHEPGTNRLFVNDMRGPLYSVSLDGKTVAPYVDINAPEWNVGVQSAGSERGFQSFAFHPQFGRPGTRGYGKFYTYTDTTNTKPAADFAPVNAQANRTHDTVLLEWTAKNPAAATYDGAAPRELIRLAQPFPNHNAGQVGFNPLAAEGTPDFGLLYVGVADGGSGGDPFEQAQNLASAFGKLFRIDPLGNNSANKQYGIPAANPFVTDGRADTLGEIYAYGLRNPQRFAWDSRNGNLFLADIGQNIVEEVSIVTAGANLGWNDWEGSFTYQGRTGVGTENPRGDAKMVYPVVEYSQADPILQGSSAVTMGYVYRGTAIKPLANLVIFGDNPSGEIFYINADRLPPNGGQDAIRRILLNDGGTQKTLLQIVKETNTKQGKTPASRADLRFGFGADDQIFLLNKRDGVIRLLTP
jgi:hypothetical protein